MCLPHCLLCQTQCWMRCFSINGFVVHWRTLLVVSVPLERPHMPHQHTPSNEKMKAPPFLILRVCKISPWRFEGYQKGLAWLSTDTDKQQKLKVLPTPWPGTQQVRVLSPCARAAGVVPGQGAYEKQPVSPNKWNNKSMFLSLFPNPNQ